MSEFKPNNQQRIAIEAMTWLCSGPRGSGKSTAMGYVALLQALAGKKVYLYDPSTPFEYGHVFHMDRRFAEHVMRMAVEYFPDYDFIFSHYDHTLTCRGLR